MQCANRKYHRLVGKALHAAGLLTVLLVLCVFYALGYAPLAEQSKSNAQRTEQLATLLETSGEVQQQHQSLRQELDALKQEIAATRKKLPGKVPQKEFESDLQRLAEGTDLRLEKLTWHHPQATPNFAFSEVNLRGSGSFASICRFLNEVSQFTRITKVSQLKLEAGENSGYYPFQVTFVLVYGIDSHDREMKGEGV